MNDVWQRYLGDIAKARRLIRHSWPASTRCRKALPPPVATPGQFALQQKLVTALKTREEFEDLMIERGVADDDADGGFRNVDFGRSGPARRPSQPGGLASAGGGGGGVRRDQRW